MNNDKIEVLRSYIRAYLVIMFTLLVAYVVVCVMQGWVVGIKQDVVWAWLVGNITGLTGYYFMDKLLEKRKG